MAYLKKGAAIPEKGAGSRLRGKMLLYVEAFCDPSSDSFQNATQSVIRAGYKIGSRISAVQISKELNRHPLVQKHINERMESRKEKMELTAEYIINKLLELTEATEKDSDRLRALELLGKSIALWKERQEISGPDGKAIEMEQKTKENADAFTNRILGLAKRAADTDEKVSTDKVVNLRDSA